MLNKLIDFAMAFWDQAQEIITWSMWDFAVYILSNLFYFILDGCLTVVENIITSIDFTVLTENSAFADWASLPVQILYVLGKLNFPAALALLSAAYLIRLTLNLIPATFTRV